MFDGVLILGVPYAGKDYVGGLIQKAFRDVGLAAELWQVGDYYYATLSEEIGVSVPEIKANKPQYRSRLQAIGSDPDSVSKGIAWARQKFDAFRDGGVLNVVIGRRDDEINMLKERNALVIYVSATLETVQERALERDGLTITEEQFNHPVERKEHEVFKHVVLHNNTSDGPMTVTYNPQTMRLVFTNNQDHCDIAIRRPALATLAQPQLENC